jgi:hypothetical protein
MPRLKKKLAPSGLKGKLSDNSQLQSDVIYCLLNAMTDCFRITLQEIKPSTVVPSKPPINADEQGWEICLADFGRHLCLHNVIYVFYVHKPRYTEETLNKKFSDIVFYLKKKIIAQHEGRDI